MRTNGLLEPRRGLVRHEEGRIAVPGPIAADGPAAAGHALVAMAGAVEADEELRLSKQLAKLLQQQAIAKDCQQALTYCPRSLKGVDSANVESSAKRSDRVGGVCLQADVCNVLAVSGAPDHCGAKAIPRSGANTSKD